MKDFKAGDFTSGKMGEIFKSCFIDDIAVINHKQFGKAYMIPDVFFRVLAQNQLLKNKKFRDFADMNFGSVQSFIQSDDEASFQEIEEFYGCTMIFDNWFDVLSHCCSANK